jgi:regulator of replication initiation timing
MSNDPAVTIGELIDKVRWLQQEIQQLHQTWKEQADVNRRLWNDNARLRAELAAVKGEGNV